LRHATISCDALNKSVQRLAPDHIVDA
jgi:uncharacterized protein YndB with AHSA1/START domain